MNWPHEKPLTPASLATDGNQGAGANTLARACDGESTASADALIRLGVTMAMQGCDTLALQTDTPARGIVEAADCITQAGEHLALPADCPAHKKGATP